MIKKLFYLLQILLLIAFSSPVVLAQRISQEEKDFRKRISEADGYFIYDEDYPSAVKIYEELFESYPDNSNLAYKLGVCYLNIKGSELKSLRLLRLASENYTEDIEYSTEGKVAPFDVLYYLAFSCQVNLELEEAIVNYLKYKSMLKVQEASEIEYIDFQIQACRNIIKAAEVGIILKKILFAPWFAEFSGAINPAISKNDSVLVFTHLSDIGNVIYFSEKNEGIWSRPIDISRSLGKHKDMFTNSLTADGKKMIICRNDGYKGDLYQSDYIDGEWTKVSKLGKNINTKYWESHGAISPDGSRLYFSSNKPGGYGSLDIYYSDLSANGSFGTPKNLGPVINSDLEENTPYFDTDSKAIYFSSTGHEGFGGYDIFQSSLENMRWSEPVHLSFPLNTPSDDLHYIPYGSYNTGIYSTSACDTTSCLTIFKVTHGIRPERDRVIAEGKISLGDGMIIDPDQIEVFIHQAWINNDIRVIRTDSSGSFNYGLDSTLYYLTISYPGYNSDTLTISVPESFSGTSISISRELIPSSVISGEFLSINSILFDFDRYNLSRDSKIELEKIIPILRTNPALKVEIRGYSDAIGSEVYNLDLSDKRAKTVYKYLVDSGIDPTRLIPIGLGETDFISLNTNIDGSDNPEGRKYNRRVSVSIQNNGYIIAIESSRFIPRHLREIHRISYYVVVMEADSPLSPGYFKEQKLGELTLVNEIYVDEVYKYCVGEFATKDDAIHFMTTVKENGFEEAYIADHYDLGEEEEFENKSTHLYTIQIHALLKPSTQNFDKLNNVRVFKGIDGYYRYIVGEYRSYSRAREALKTIREKGYEQAYIKDFSLLEEQTERK